MKIGCYSRKAGHSSNVSRCHGNEDKRCFERWTREATNVAGSYLSAAKECSKAFAEFV